MSRLNPNAVPFEPVYTDQHALFLTFSNGRPLKDTQIFNYFNRFYEPYVERVYVHKPSVGPPLFGKIVFNRQLIPTWLMGEHEKICFVVDGLPLFCKRFVSEPTRAVATASTSVPNDGNHSGGEE